MSSHNSSKSVFVRVVGWIFILISFLSVLTCFGPDPIINTPGEEGADMLGSIAVGVTGVLILLSASKIAAAFGVIILVLLMFWVGWDFDGKKAVHVTTSAAEIAVAVANNAGAEITRSSGSSSGGSSTGPAGYKPRRPLNARESAECEQKLQWTYTDAGKRNCKQYKNKHGDLVRYIWDKTGQ